MADAEHDSLREVASAIAHDLNNLMTAVLAYSELYRSSEELPAGARRAFAEIFDAGTQAAELTQRLMAISRRHE